MAKGLKVALLVSLLLNAALIVGFLFFRNYVRTEMFKLVATTAQSKVNLLENILSDLDPNDPVKITALKERLHKNIQRSQTTADIWQQAADR